MPDPRGRRRTPRGARPLSAVDRRAARSGHNPRDPSPMGIPRTHRRLRARPRPTAETVAPGGGKHGTRPHGGAVRRLLLRPGRARTATALRDGVARRARASADRPKTTRDSCTPSSRLVTFTHGFLPRTALPATLWP